MPLPSLQPTTRPNRRGILAAAFAFGLALSTGVMGAEPKALVSLVVDYGDGVSVHFTDLNWREGMTVFDALSAARAHRHGITFSHRGSGSTVMVTKIGDLTNEGDGKNWMYSVNDKAGDVSAGVRPLKPLDAVLWKFQVYDYNP